MPAEEGIEKSAILLVSLGEEHAAEVLKHLGPREVQKLGAAMAQLKSVPRDKVEAVVDQFYEETQRGAPVTADEEYIRGMLTKALGDDRAANLISRILQGGDTAGIEGLKWMDAATVAELIRNEHPQIIASILVHLERDQASAVLMQLTERLRHDVMVRIATLDGIQPNALRELNDVLMKVLAGGEKLKRKKLGGTKAAAEILNFFGGSNETAVLDAIREHDADLAQRIADQMFTFEDLNNLDDRAIQLLLREVQNESLIVALKGADGELRERIFRNMSQRAAETMREDLESKGPVRLSEVEAEQKEILKIVRRLADEGQIALGGGGEDAFV